MYVIPSTFIVVTCNMHTYYDYDYVCVSHIMKLSDIELPYPPHVCWKTLFLYLWNNF